MLIKWIHRLCGQLDILLIRGQLSFVITLFLFRHIQPLSSFLTSPCHLLYSKWRSLSLSLSLSLVHSSIFYQKSLILSVSLTLHNCFTLYSFPQPCISAHKEVCTSKWLPSIALTRMLHRDGGDCADLPRASSPPPLHLSSSPSHCSSPSLQISPAPVVTVASHPLTQFKPNLKYILSCQSLHSVLIYMTCLCYSLLASLPDPFSLWV